MYEALDKELNSRRRYTRANLLKGENAIDRFYNSKGRPFKNEALKSRYCKLKLKNEIYSNVDFPVNVTVIFGLVTGLAVFFLQTFVGIWNGFDDDIKKLIDDFTSKSGPLTEQQNINVENIVSGVKSQLSLYAILLIFLFIIVIIVYRWCMKRNFESGLLRKHYSQYEMNMIDRCLNESVR